LIKDGRAEVSGPKRGERQEPGSDDAVHVYCLGTLVADEASRSGLRDFARSLEAALENLLSGLPRDEQATALRLSYEMALGGAEPAPPRLRLVYSRD
jgi:hypothetical protein